MRNDIPFSPRLIILWKQSHLEAGFGGSDIPDPSDSPSICIYPETFITRVNSIGFDKTIDFNFRGVLYLDKVTHHNRQWVISFAERHFTSQSLFQATDKKAKRWTWFLGRRHKCLGEFDCTFDRSGFVPKENPVGGRGYFDDDYFTVLCRSHFTLCPAGDAPWSMRFHEAILCKSIPIVEHREHTGRNELEYGLGYRYYLAEEEPKVFRQSWVEENYRTFIERQTLMSVG